MLLNLGFVMTHFPLVLGAVAVVCLIKIVTSVGAVRAIGYDAPTAAAAAGMSVNEQTDLTISGKGFSIADVDAGNDQVKVTLTVVEGKLTVTAGNSGIDWVDNTGTGTVTVYGSQSEINALLAGNGTAKIVYRDDTDTPADTTKLTLTVNDQANNGEGGAKSASVFTTIDLNDTNDKPVTDLNGASKTGADGSATFTEQTAVLVAPAGTVNDDSNTVSSMTVTLTSRPNGNGVESLSLNATAAGLAGGLSVSYTATTGVLLISGSASASTYQSILQGVLYNNSSDTPDESNRTVTVTVKDGANLVSDSHSVTVAVNAVNDAPVADMTQTTFAASEQTALILSGKGLSISDVDAASDQMTVTLSVGQGVLNVDKGNSGVDSVSGSGTGTVTIKGSVTEINYLLKGIDNGNGNAGVIEYLNNSDAPAASTSLTFKVSDQGHNGDGGTLTDTEVATINIAALNDAPIACDDNVVTNAGANLFNIPEWALVYNDSDADSSKSSFDLIAGATAVFNASGGSASHTNGTGAEGFVSFTDSGGNGGSFDYKMTDGSLTDTGHVTVSQDTNGTLSGSNNDDIVVVYGSGGTTVEANGGDDIVIGGGGDDKLDGGSGNDLIFGGAGDDTMIFGGGDKYDGGSGFDQVKNSNGNTDFAYDKNAYLGVEMVDIGDTNDRSNSQNTFSLSAGDLVAGATGTSLNGHSIALYVIGDHSGSSSGRDNVDLTGFNLTAVATNIGFKDNVSDATHYFNVYEAAGGVKVAVETGLDVS
jgi:hypothetical protein